MKIKFVAVLFFAFVLSILALTFYFLNSNPERGTFGDMFGVANALFTGFAFAAAGLAIYIQSIQLRETKESIKKAESVQLETLNTQKQILQIQRFESIASIKLKKIEVNALLYSSSREISHDLESEIDELIEKIEAK